MGLALDESNESDEVVTSDGVTFIIEKELLEQLKEVSVDYVVNDQGEGFIITSAQNNPDACGGCSGGC